MATAALQSPLITHPAVTGSPANAAATGTKVMVRPPMMGNPGNGNSSQNAANRIVQAVYDSNNLNRGSLSDYMPKPTQTIFTVNNVAGGGAAAITAWFMNEDYLLATPTDNGSGAGSVVKTYNDGFGGSLLNQVALSYGIEGLPFKEIQLVVVDNTTGQQDKAATTNASPTRYSYNADGTKKDDLIPMASAGNPIYNQQGFLIVQMSFRMRRFEQIQLTLPVNKTLTMILVPA